jgi:poly-gamma-glutamate synthesis protein (capsule biosynthesis protein)
MKRTRKLRSSFRNMLLIILLGCVIYLFYKIENKPLQRVALPKEATIMEQVSPKLENVDPEFLKWVDENYPKSLKKMLTLLKDPYKESMWHNATGYSYQVLQDFYQKKYESMDNVKILKHQKTSTLSFVGDVSLADNWFIMPEYDKRAKGIYGILSEDTVKLMKDSTLMVANSEFTVSERGQAIAGKQYTFRAHPSRLKIYEEMGVDLVTLANNHVYDFGKEAFLDMLDAFQTEKIPYIGAGRNLEEAMKPYYFIINGYKFAFLNATRAEKYILTPGATETSEGVFRCYDRTNLLNQIQAVKKESDYVITIVHFGTEGSHTLEEEQMASARAYIDAGSDAIVGHHAHVLQGVEFYNHKPIIYNLGNFIFNAETIDTAIFQIQVTEEGIFTYYMIPALQKNEYTALVTGTEKERILKDLNSWSIHATMNTEGQMQETV